MTASTRQNRDPLILRTLTEHPGWLHERVFPRLDGHPDTALCWLWTGYKNPAGYGQVALPKVVAKKQAVVHRVVWLALRGPIPDGHVIDHDGDGCGNRSCANPNHVAAVPERINVVVNSTSACAAHATKTHCPEGHPLAGDNLVPGYLERGMRLCLTCRRQKTRQYNARQRAAADALGITLTELRQTHGTSRAALNRIIGEHV